MALQRMCDFVSHHRRQTGIRFGVLQDAREDGDFPTGETEGVDHLVVFDDGELPLIFRLVGHARDFSSYALDLLVDLRVFAQTCFPQDFAIGAQTELQLLFLGEKDQLIACCSRSTVAS